MDAVTAGYRRSAGARHRELLDRVTDDLAVNGLVDFSLRRAARAAGTTHKVLLYYFDDADLLAQAVFRLRERRIRRAVLVSCDAFDNFPPGLTGKTLVLTGKLAPPTFGVFMQQMRLRPVRRLPIAFGWLTRSGDAATARWMKPVLSSAGIRRDTVRMLRAIAADTDVLIGAAEGLPGFGRPALVVWASEDRVMPVEHGRRLAGLLGARLVEVADSYTLIPLDQPTRLARLIREFAPVPETT